MEKRRILITGACSGFGSTVYRHLKGRGHTVIGCGFNGPDFATDFLADVNANVEDLLKRIVDKCGHFDILINNAGMIDLAPLVQLHQVMLEDTIYLNMTFPILLTAASVSYWWRDFPNERPFPKFRVINTTSMCTQGAGRMCHGYNASKAGLENFTRGCAREAANAKIKGTPVIFCNIAPSIVEHTGMQQSGLQHLMTDRRMSEKEAEQYQTANPMGRRIQHDELCKVFEFAVEDMPEAMSGTTLRIPLACGM